MHRLAILATVGQAYRFLFGELGTIIRLSWLPCAAFIAVLLVLLFANIAPPAKNEAEATPWTIVTLFAIATSIISIIAVALHRVILFGDRKEGRFGHFAFGRFEALFFVLLLLYGLLFGGGILGYIVSYIVNLLPRSIVVGTSIAAIAVLIWVSFRLSLIFPITLVEGRYDFTQTWALTRGNFWRLLATWIVGIAPLSIIALPGMVLVAALGETNETGSGPGEAGLEYVLLFLKIIAIVPFLFYWIASFAIGVALLSYSYKALSGYAPEQLLQSKA
jgi:hypothetical protein